MLVFEEINTVNSLIGEIIKLRNSIKCPICLEIVNNPVEINCDHIFCEECLNTFANNSSSKLKCPICKKNVKRQRNKPCENIEVVSKFVTTITNKLERASQSRKDKLDKEKSPESPKGIFCFESSNISHEHEKNAFDLIMGPSSNYTVKKDKVVKTYSKKKTKYNKDELYEKLINFEDNNCRLKIIEWLCDNRNKFDRLTQTQSIIDDDSESSFSSFDMPSISQDVELRTYRKKRKRTKSVRRTRSLDVKIKTSNFKLRNHSFSGESQKEIENIDIEEIESDKDALNQDHVNILQILEEKCLNTIDTQVLLQEKVNSNSEKPNRKRKRRKSSNQNKTSKDNLTGWKRMEQINKTINKKNRETKKLCVNLSSSTKVEKKQVLKGGGQAHHSKIYNPVIILNSLSAEVELHKPIIKRGELNSNNLNKTSQIKHTSSPIVALERLNAEDELHAQKLDKRKPKSYNLKDVESYISNNINLSNEIQKGSTDNNNVDLILTGTSGTEKADCKQNKLTSPVFNTSAIAKVCGKEEKNEKESDDWNFICKSSQGSSKKKPKLQSDSIFPLKNNTEEIDDIFEVPTQIIKSDSSVDSIEQNLIALFSSPNTDKEVDSLNPNDEINKINDAFNLLKHLNKIVCNLEETIQKSNNIETMKLCIEKLGLLLPKHSLKEREVNCLSNTTQTVEFDFKSVAVQTEECDSSGFKISSTADFKTLVQHTVGVQTDLYVNDAFITIDSDSLSSRTSEVLVSNNDILNNLKENYQFTESLDNINFDTQVIVNHNKKGKKNKLNDLKVPKAVKKRLDFNNDTEPAQIVLDTDSNSDENSVVEHEKTVIPAVSSNNISETLLENHSNDSKSSKQKSQTSNILFSLSKGYSNNNAINQNEPSKIFKRIRSLNDDSDSDTGVCKKYKKNENPYITDNLSVNIDSQDSQDENEEILLVNEKPMSPQSHTSMNYDEYLDRIMTRYSKIEEQSALNTVNPLHISKQTKSQEIIDRCNALIKEVTNSPHTDLAKSNISKDDYITNDIVEEFNLPFDEKIADKRTTQPAKEHKNLQSKAKENFSESMFCSETRNTKVPLTDELPFSNMESLAREFSEELNPIPEMSVTNYKRLREIKVLQNFLLQKGENGGGTSQLQYNLEDELQKMEEVTKGSEKSEEVFSDSDIEIIETTPQKKKPVNNVSFMSQSLHKRHSSHKSDSPLLLPSPEESPDVISSIDVLSFFNKTFAPPTAFQDIIKNDRSNDNINDITNTDASDITIVPSNMINEKKEDDYIDLDVTLTEKINTIHVNKNFAELERSTGENTKNSSLGLFTSSINSIKKDDNKTTRNAKVSSNVYVKSESTNKIKMNHVNEQDSCSINTKSLNISPIERNSKDLNPIERALKSNFSPLEVIVKSQPKRMSKLSTSTPKKQKTILSYVNNEIISSGESKHNSITSIQPTLSQRSKPCIASTRISKDQQNSIYALVNKKLATYSGIFNSSVTHMIVLVDEKNCIMDHTIKFVSAVAAGIWVLRFEWVLECVRKNEIVPEEPYEALDVSGVAGPRIGRLTKSQHSLLKDFRIHVATPCLALNKSDIENVIRMLGGKVVPTMELLRENHGIRLIITEAKTTQDFDIYETWLEELKVATVDIEWLSRSVGKYRILSLKQYILCSEDTLRNIGYPEELLLEVPASSSPSTSYS